MPILQLRHNGRPLFVNVSQIRTIVPSGTNGSKITFDETHSVFVDEDPGRIAAMVAVGKS